MLVSWNHVLERESSAAGLYEAWFRHLTTNVASLFGPDDVVARLGLPYTRRVVEWLTSPGGEFGASPTAGRDSLLLVSLREGVAELTGRFGADTSGWRWGAYHQARLPHPMSAALSESQRRRFDVGPWPRGGDDDTPGATGGGETQSAGASFRLIVEAGDWDGALGTNAPGQSGDVTSPHYRDLFELWKDDRYFPVKYSRPAVDAVTRTRTVLAPAQR